MNRQMEIDKLNQLRGLVAAKRLHAEDIASALGISAATYYRKLNGASDFSLSEVSALIKFLGLTPDEANKLFF